MLRLLADKPFWILVNLRKLMAMITLLVSLVSVHGVVVFAQPSVATNWSTPELISDLPSTVGGSAVVGDAAGNVYLIWLANSEEKVADQVDTVYFRRWNGSDWTPSVDILAGAFGEPWIRVDAFTLDAFGRLVLLWHQGRNLTLSIADPAEADNANNWRSLPLPSSELVFQSGMVTGSDGTFHILVVGEGQNIHYMRSEDDGETWKITQVSTGTDPARQYSWGSLALDRDDSNRLYTTWTESREEDGWAVTGIYFSQSQDGGETWSEPKAIVSARGHGHSTITVGPDKNLMILWNRAVGSVDGRYYAISTDQGATWDQPQVAFEGVSGLTWSPSVFLDSLGQLHMIGAGFGAGNENIWYSQWDTSRWTAPQQIRAGDRSMIGNEVFSARLVGGNRLLYSWTDAATKDIWFTSQILPGPSVADVRLDLPALITAIPTVQSDTTAVVAAPAPQSTPMAFTGNDQPTEPPLPSLVMGILPAAFLVTVVVVVGIRKRGRA